MITTAELEIVNELGQLHPHVFEGIHTIMDARSHYDLDESSIDISLIKDLKLYTLTAILSIDDVHLEIDTKTLSIKETNTPWSLSTMLNGIRINELIRFATFRFPNMSDDKIVLIKIEKSVDTKLSHSERRIPNGTVVTQIDTDIKLKIIDALETDNRFGYGVYLYRFEGRTDTGFGLYRREIKLPENPVYLQSLHPYNFRHGSENARIIGFELYTPENHTPRPCFKVIYDSDDKIDYIPHSEIMDGHWGMFYL